MMKQKKKQLRKHMDKQLDRHIKTYYKFLGLSYAQLALGKVYKT